MKERSFNEMIAYFNRRVSEMDIDQGYKIELLGMVTALGYKHEKTAQPEIIRCKDCKHYEILKLKSDYTDDKRYKPSVCVVGRYAVHRSEDWFCADAERRTE